GEISRAKAFWEKRDVDKVFNTVLGHLNHLKMVLKKNTATDKGWYVQGLKLLESLDCCPPASAQDSVVQVVIGTGELDLTLEVSSCPGGFLLPDISQPSPSCSPSSSPLPPSNGSPGSAAPPAGREELLPSLSPVHLQFLPHSCCEVTHAHTHTHTHTQYGPTLMVLVSPLQACLSTLPSMPQSLPLFWGQNPLKIPLLCGFKRLTARPLMSPGEGAEDWGVVYKAPCGLSLCSYEDVMCFLWATGSYDILRVDFFTFNTSVRLDPPRSIGPQRPELDLSRGAEPTPVELCPGDAGARPPDFRYRKDRWPHGCFLSRCEPPSNESGPLGARTLFSALQAALAGGPQPASPASGDETAAQEKTAAATESSPEAAAVHGVNGAKTERKRLKRAMTVEDINFLDASKEGNVGRFINHSCQPNLFLQNVFTDSHDPSFPVIAFFTMVKAGAELTWNYSADTLRKREVPCLCGGGGCHGHFSIEESLCDVCEADGETR
uniref:Histone-lysine N-methyltransferase SETDB2 n=1 Tax=Mola mola TaxID=94237 RepID=A0A3Q4BET6_MOLML